MPLINLQPQAEHRHSTPQYSCRNCHKWERCKLGENRPASLTADYGLYGCIGHQLNSNDEKKKV